MERAGDAGDEVRLVNVCPGTDIVRGCRTYGLAWEEDSRRGHAERRCRIPCGKVGDENGRYKV